MTLLRRTWFHPRNRSRLAQAAIGAALSAFVSAREVGSLGAGDHLVPLTDQPALPAGVYLVRLTQGQRTLTAKACVVK